MESLQELVEKVKDMQRLPGGQVKWAAFVANNGGGKRDPSFRSPEDLRLFLAEAGAGNAPASGTGLPTTPQEQQMMMMMMLPWMQQMQQMQQMQNAPVNPTALALMSGGGGGNLVQRVKDVQKKPGGREKWQEFVDRKGGGKRDPAMRSEIELHEFLLELSAGSGKSNANAKYFPTSQEHAQAVARVKFIQKRDGAERWSSYMDSMSSGKRDPAAHPIEVLQVFLDQIDPNGETIGVEADYDESQALIMTIKRGQSKSEQFKDAWISYVENHGGDVRDPSRHGSDFLKMFLQIAPSPEPAVLDDRHQQLVQQVKEGQRSNPLFRNAWIQYCQENGRQKHDPACNEAEFLEMFLNNPAIQELRWTQPQEQQQQQRWAQPSAKMVLKIGGHRISPY